jgi:hypothetical protein
VPQDYDEAASQKYPDTSLDQILTFLQRIRLRLHVYPHLTEEQEEVIRVLLNETYLAGHTAGKAEGLEQSAGSSPQSAPTSIESRIDGAFEGWEGETIVKLMNGQIWLQTEYYYHYHYSYMPEVLIYSSGSGYKMKVNGVNRAVRVRRIN